MTNKAPKKNSGAQMAKYLINVVSDTYLLMIKTHSYHWNVTGPLFPQLHAFFDVQYNELFVAVDEIAERVRALDFPAPSGADAFKENSIVKEGGAQPPSASAMLKDLLKTNEVVRDRIVEARAFAGEIEDTASEDLMNKRLEVHDKAIWMLRSQVS